MNGMGRKVDFDDCRLQMEKPLSAINLSEESEGDSDQRQLFELPKRKVHRPSTSSFKKRIGTSQTTCCGRTGLCCKVCFSTLVPIFVATFVAFTIIFFIVLTMGMSGINKELEGLKIKISYAEDAEKDFNAKRDKLRKDFENQLLQLSKEKQEIETFKYQINSLSNQVKTLNASLQKLRSHPSFDAVAIKSDLDKLKTGMADTGSSISKLENTHSSLVKKVDSIEAKSTKLSDDVYNMTVRVAKLESSPLPPPRTTTSPKVVVTLTPNDDTPVKMKEFKRTIKDLENKQRDICDVKADVLMKKIEVLQNHTNTMNQTYYLKFSMLSRQREARADKVETTTTQKPSTTVPMPKIGTTSKMLSNADTAPSTRLPSTTALPAREKQSSELYELDSISKNFHTENNRDTMRKRDLRDVLKRTAHRRKSWNREGENDDGSYQYFFDDDAK